MNGIMIRYITNENELKSLSSVLMQRLYSEEQLKWCDHSFPDMNLFSDCIFAFRNELPVGRIVLYRNGAIRYGNEKPMLAGNYECEKDDETAAMILKEAVASTRSKGYNFLIGPMNGYTWNNYRFAQDWEEPLFFSERYHQPYYPHQWEKNGFEIISRYFSARQDDLKYDNEYLNDSLAKFSSDGITIRQISAHLLENDLRKVFPLCKKAFAGNPFYTDMDEDLFVQKYLEQKKFMNPEIILLAERNQKVVGFIFCLRNLADPDGKGVIVKTIARDEDDIHTKGMGAVLSSIITKYTLGNNLEYMLHAFMHHSNNSVKLSGQFSGKIIRKYYLFGKKC
jgi:hypothetical protein